jgi:hypothetical protein
MEWLEKNTLKRIWTETIKYKVETIFGLHLVEVRLRMHDTTPLLPPIRLHSMIIKQRGNVVFKPATISRSVVTGVRRWRERRVL